MNERNWIDDIQWQDVTGPTTDLGTEVIYTLKMGDFLSMPNIDFEELALLDPQIRVLLN